MLKSKAIELLGGTVPLAADAIGVTPQAVGKWPPMLPKRIADRVVAAIARRHLPPSIIGDDEPEMPSCSQAPAPDRLEV